MAEEIATIPKSPDLRESMDYAFLKREGIDYSQQLSGDIWTDYNVHDPGVTILENLCFAITELAYKSNFKVEDILFSKSSEKLDLEKNALYPPQDVFPCNPQLERDYRKLLIDHLYPNVENAWLIPQAKNTYGINMQGLYAVRLLVKDDPSVDKEAVKAQAISLLNLNRNLCEDFDTVEVLRPLKISIRAEAEINPNALGETVMGQILFNLLHAITPNVRFESLESLQESGLLFSQIFNGPAPVHGFVRNEDLRISGLHTLQNVPRSSRLMNAVREIQGLDDIKQFQVGVFLKDKEALKDYLLVKYSKRDSEIFYLTPADDDLPVGHSIVPTEEIVAGFYLLKDDKMIPDGYFPLLDIDSVLAHTLLRLTIDGLNYDPDQDIVTKNLEMLHARDIQQYQAPMKYNPRIPESEHELADIERYFSVQETFPQAYGVGDFGLPNRSTPERRAYARQLKGYLFFFDQVLANYLSQLSHFHKLFDLEMDPWQTYFTQFPEVPNEDWIIPQSQGRDVFLEKLDELNTKFDPSTRRKNQAMDHLLARFGEEFLSDAFNTLNRKAVASDQDQFEIELTRAKVKFLLNYVELSRERGRGFNYRVDPDVELSDGRKEPSNVAILKKRISLLFNIHDYSHRPFSQAFKEQADVKVANRSDKPSKGKKNEESESPRKSFTFNTNANDILPEVMVHGLMRENYAIRKQSNKVWDIFFMHPESGAEQKIYSGSSSEDCEASVLELIQKLRELNKKSEGFHLVEHVLLRPIAPIMHYYYLFRGDRIFIRSQKEYTEDFLDEFCGELDKFGRDEKNYSITGNRKSGYQINLKDKGRIVAMKSGFISKESAEKERQDILDYLKRLDPEEIRENIRVEEHIPRGALLSDDFYSLTLSAIAPSWPARFQNDKIRSLFEQILKLNAPAHLNIKVFWVDLEEMSDFELIYQQWLVEKSHDVPVQPKLDELSYCLLVLVKFFEDPSDPLVKEEMPRLKQKYKLKVKFLDE